MGLGGSGEKEVQEDEEDENGEHAGFVGGRWRGLGVGDCVVMGMNRDDR